MSHARHSSRAGILMATVAVAAVLAVGACTAPGSSPKVAPTAGASEAMMSSAPSEALMSSAPSEAMMSGAPSNAMMDHSPSPS